ncbi:hypothetical protein LTR40_004801 [Exophiala xenobiotica]|nr:hypothetical protein LTR40_004801 [Exophiala xenobiotica]
MSSFYSNPQAFFDMMAQANPNLPVPPSFPSPAEIRRKSRAYSKEIFNSWTNLRDVLARREEVIRKRWMNKRKEQRKKILLAAWPGMPERHRPDFYELQKTGSRAASKNIEAFKYPYVNQEDLLQGRALLLFLNSRGRNPPHSFAHADLDATHVGQTSKMIIPVFLNEYTMYIAPESDPDSYGRLVSWDDDDDAFMLMHNCLQFQPGTGLFGFGNPEQDLFFPSRRCVDHDPSQKDRMSSCVAGYFSDLALIAQLVRQVKTFFPWAAGLELEMSPGSRSPGYAKAMEDAATVYRFLREDITPNLARNVVPLSRHLHYPIEKAHNVTNVNACRQAEDQLDRLWKPQCEGSRDPSHARMDTSTKSFPAAEQGEENEALGDSFSRLNVEPDKPGKFKGPEVSRASKFKTRGPSHPPDSSDATQPVPDDPTPPFPVFTLPRRAYKVFASLFPTPSNPSQGGEISWTDFLHAMTSIGFAAEKLYGSVWQFTPPDGLDWENTNTRGIHIHEPHPVPKMGLGTARRVGRRLERRYGLNAERFALA